MVIKLKKINVLKNNRDFNRIIAKYKPYKGKDFIIYVEKNTNDVYHFGISVGKKIGNAVIRNTYKRKIRSIIDKNNYQNGFNCIIILKKSILDREFNEINFEMKDAFKKINIIKE